MAFQILQAYNQLIFGCYGVFTDLKLIVSLLFWQRFPTLKS